MTLLLAHPAAEDLGRFVEGTLPDSERGEVVAHIADCDECRILVVDASEFIEPAKKESPRWWAAVAASILILAGGGYFWNASRDLRADMIAASSKLSRRPTQARLADFPYVELNRMRGSGEDGVDIAETNLEAKIADVLDRRGDDPKTMHAKGVAYLLAAGISKERDEIVSDRINALNALQSAVDRAPDNVTYQTDLAAALLTTGDKTKRQAALNRLDKVLAIDPSNQDALFNRAVALENLERTSDAIAAYDRYLAVDSASPWAAEAKRHREDLRELLATP